MKTIALLFSLLLLLIFGFLIFENFFYLSFNWQDLLIFAIVALIIYLIIRWVGGSLDKRFNKSVKDFLDGKKKELFDDRGLLRVFGLLLIILLPFLIYLFALAFFAAIDFATYGLLAISYSPYIPIALLIGLAIVVLGTGLAILIGFFRLLFPPRRKTLGIEIAKNEQKKLWQLTQEIAIEIKAKPIDKIIITPDPGIGVYLEGNLFAIIFGGGRQVLEIGLSSLHDLRVDEFKAILAHEYGHFSNRDTQWSSFTFSMGNSLISTLQSVPGPTHDAHEEVGMVRIIMSFNPAYWLLLLFITLYFKITNGFSRIREVMADIRAMNLYGGRAFADGLLKVATNDIVFSEIIQGRLLSHYLEEGQTIINFSKFMELLYKNAEEKTVKEIRNLLFEESKVHNPYDSHPSLRTRINYAKKFFIGEEKNKKAVSALFDNWDQINEKVAEIYNSRLLLYAQLLNRIAEEEKSVHDK